ncbi:MAG TPA: hypothetical protein VIK72_04845 [Clostridiaceae bacterium]
MRLLGMRTVKTEISVGLCVFIGHLLKLEYPFIYSLNRILDTFLGISISLLINYIIFPPKHLEKIFLQSNILVDTTVVQ